MPRQDRVLRILQRLVAREGLMRAVGRLNGPFNPWLPQNRRDPYPAYRRLRERNELVRMRIFGGWVATRYEHVERVLRDRCFSTNRDEVALMKFLRRATEGAPDFADFVEHNLLMIDGPRHARLRGLVAKAFTPRRVERLRPRVEALVEELLERTAEREEMDVVADLARPLPAIVIGEMLGVPVAERERFSRWSDEAAQLLDPLSGQDGFEPPKRAIGELAAYFRTLLAERRLEPRDDLISAMLAAEESGERLQEAELVALASLLLGAGHETTTNLIGNAVATLLRHPDERKRLQDDPGLLPGAVEEFLRFESPVQLTDRAVVEPCELGGVALRRGDIVVAVLASANRDPDAFPEPDRFDVGRADNRHLAFGLGAHFCLGAGLARLEAQAAIGTLLRRFPDFCGDPDPPDWKSSIVLRGPTSLRIRLR